MRALRLVLACGLLGLAPVASRADRAPAKTPAADRPRLMFQGFRARASHDGALVWEARADRARVEHDGLRARAENVTVVYYKRGKVVSRARADAADIGLKDYDIEAEGAVELRSSDGIVLRTPHLFWDNRAQRVHSDSPVTVLRGRTKLTGVGFVADRDLRDVRILRDVHAEALSVRALRQELKSWPRR